MNNSDSSLTPRRLSYIFAASIVALSALLFYPFTLFFRGSWEARPFVQFITINDIKLKIPGWESNGTWNAIFQFLSDNGIEWFGFRYYSLMLFLGAVLGFFLMLYFFSRKNIAETTSEKIFVTFVLLGLLGARSLFVLINLPYYTDKPNEILNLQGGGFSVYGAMILCGLYLLWYSFFYKFNLRTLLDSLVPSLLVVHILARFGNFFNYEIYGKPTQLPWKMYVPEGAVLNNRYPIGETIERFYHPTFLYESIINGILLVFLLFFYTNLEKYKHGMIFAIYAIVYGLSRLLLETIRLDVTKIGNLQITWGSLFSVIIIIIGVYILIGVKPNKKVF